MTFFRIAATRSAAHTDPAVSAVGSRMERCPTSERTVPSAIQTTPPYPIAERAMKIGSSQAERCSTTQTSAPRSAADKLASRR